MFRILLALLLLFPSNAFCATRYKMVLADGTTGNVGIGTSSTSDKLLVQSSSGGISIVGSGTSLGFFSQYPPAHNDTYVKATSVFDGTTYPYLATNPAKGVTGAYYPDAEWIAGTYTNQRLHIDLGAAKTITKIYYENHHNSGAETEYGVKTFTFWGSNTAGAFSTLTYATDTNWTQLATSQGTFDRHVAANTADPKYITVTNTTPYRYYAFKFSDGYIASTFMCLRKVELQSETVVAQPALSLNSTAGTTSKVWTDGNASNAFKIDVPATTRLTIDTNGNTGIGTTLPTRTLDVVGTSNISSTATFGGNVGVGTVSPRSALDVNGTVTATSLFEGDKRIGMSLFSTASPSSASSFKVDLPAGNYKLIFYYLQNTNDSRPYIRFNEDTGNNYYSQYGLFYGSGQSNNYYAGISDASSSSQLFSANISATYYGMISAEIMCSGNNVFLVVNNLSFNTATRAGIVSGRYSGASPMSSLTIAVPAGTMTGNAYIYKYN